MDCGGIVGVGWSDRPEVLGERHHVPRAAVHPAGERKSISPPLEVDGD